MHVSVYKMDGETYPEGSPFHPSQSYPEAIFSDTAESSNAVYAGVRELFLTHGLDADNFGQQRWNPLGELIKPGDTVIVKPNLIKEKHPRDPDGWIYMMTHGSVIRAVCDYVVKALRGSGRIIVADAPQTDSSFSEICMTLGLNELREFYRSNNIDFELVDIRKYEWKSVDDVIVSRRVLPGDPKGYVKFDLGRHSMFYGHSGEGRYYGADYDTGEINAHHHGEVHEYVISGSAINADVFINLPKLKTHKKTGVTLSLKNLVGINGDKNYLPHYTEGVPEDGGDQFPEKTAARSAETAGLKALRKTALAIPVLGPWLYRFAKRLGGSYLGKSDEVIRSGNWFGNDTTWRMCVDLNRLLLHGNPDGTYREDDATGRKRYLTLIDGVIGGDGNGPIDVDPRYSGVMILGNDPVAVDAVGATLMGLDPKKIPVVWHAFDDSPLKLTEESLDTISVRSNRDDWNGPVTKLGNANNLGFRPHFGWRDKIEFSDDEIVQQL